MLAQLGIARLEDLLPLPSKLSAPPELIETPDPQRVLTALAQSADRRVVAHGNAGVGKTTTVLRLQRLLPPGSVSIVFDCYDGGDYLKVTTPRHHPERVLTQLCNELAVRCRLPLLLGPPPTLPDLWREFQRRLDSAAASLRAVGAELMVVIDAADNSVWAAKRESSPSLMPGLWEIEVPEGAGLVVTSRSTRRVLLNPPTEIAQVDLRGFDRDASAAHLRMRFSHASDQDCAEFHDRSQGNPRVQDYVLGLPDTDSLARAVKQAELTPKELFEDLWSSAVEQTPEPGWAGERLADLMTLKAPVTIERLAQVAGSPSGSILTFCHALAPGLRIDVDVVVIRDEDFERFLDEEKLSEQQITSAHSRLADSFAATPEDPYAAAVLADHLLGAGRMSELLELAVEAGPPGAITDPLVRLQVYRRRLRLALENIDDPRPQLQAAKLLLLAARAAYSDSAVTDVIRRRPDLALRHGDPTAVAEVWRQDRNLSWQGPVHLRLAAMAARSGEAELARSELESANAWLRRRSREDETDWDIEADDMAAALEAVYLLEGPEAVIARLRRWRPWQFVWTSLERFVVRLLRAEAAAEVADLIFTLSIPPQIKGRLLARLNLRPDDVDEPSLRRLARTLAREPTRADHRKGVWPLDFIELVASVTADRSLVRRLLRRFEFPLPTLGPMRWEGLARYRPVLRHRAMLAVCEQRPLSSDELEPVEPKDKTGHSAEEERRTFSSEVRPWIGIYRRRAATLLGRPRAQSIGRSLRLHLEKIASADRRWHEPDRMYAHWVQLVCEMMLVARGTNRPLVRRAAEVADVALPETADEVRGSIGTQLIGDRRYQELAAILIDKAAKGAIAKAQPARDLADTLLDLAAQVDPHNTDLAADLFNNAIVAAEGLDDQGVAALDTHARIASNLAGDPQAPLDALRIADALISYVPRVSDERILPWRETLEGLTAMHAPTGFAVMSRWEDRRHLRIGDSIGWVLDIAVRTGFLDPIDALALSHLQGTSGPSGHRAIALLDHLAGEGRRPELIASFEHLSLLVRRDLSGQARSDKAGRLLAWAQDNWLGDSQAALALELYPDLVVKTEGESPRGPWENNQERERKRLMKKAERGELRDIGSDLDQLARVTFSDEDFEEFLSRLAASIPPTRRVEMLSAVSGIDTKHRVMRFYGHAVLGFLINALGEWQNSVAVRSWRDKNLKPFLIDHLPSLLTYRESNAARLAQITQLLDKEESANVAIAGAAANIDQLRPDTMHALVSQVAQGLVESEVTEFLNFSFDLLEVEKTAAKPVEIESSADILAALIWAQFGNPEKSARWLAAHALRRLINEGTLGSALATAMVDRASTRDGAGFTDPDLKFLWISAQAWTYMTLARVADESPSALLAHCAHFEHTALSVDWPHASIREFARRAWSRLLDPSEMEGEAATEFELANRAKSCLSSRGSHYGPSPSFERPDPRWSFDMDTESYWFEGLADCFAASKLEIAALAESWLIDKLGETNDRFSWRREPRLTEREHSNAIMHHGSVPGVEPPTLALEYHAMQLAGGELLDQPRAISVERYEPLTDSWTDWLARFLEERPESWMVDLRHPTPPERAFIDPGVSKGRWPEVGEDHFDLLLGYPDADRLVVDGYFDYQADAGYAYDSIHSALVEPSTSASFARALERAEHMSFFGFPFERENGNSHGHAIDAHPFVLSGWLEEHDPHREGIERDDPLARIGTTAVLPGPSFIQHHSASLARKTRSIVGSDGSEISWVRQFSDHSPETRERYGSGFSTAGRQTFVSTPRLLDFLRATGMSLIIKVEVVRRDKKSEDEETRKDDQRIQRAFLLRADGRFTGLRRRRSLG